MPTIPDKMKQNIEIKGARVHNLKNIDVEIPRNKLIVITGLSGSGKSSLAFDTIYAEGQRRYVESLSSYARQFLERMHKPEVDYIKGIPPAISIERKANTRNPRSTVGTTTEIYDFLKLLFARIGKTYSPISNKIVKRHTVTNVVNFLCTFKENTRGIIITSIEAHKDCTIQDHLRLLLKQGINRVEINNEIKKIIDVLEDTGQIEKLTEIKVVIDRIVIKRDEDSLSRFADSVQTAFNVGKGYCSVKVYMDDSTVTENFSNRFEADGIEFEEPTTLMFSFNNPVGACSVCEGYGNIIGIDENLVIPNNRLSVYNDAIVCWKGRKMIKWKERLIYNANKFDFPVHKPYYELTENQKLLLWTGNKYFKGLNAFFDYIEKKKYKIQYRVMISRYRGKTLCPECKGTRLRKEAAYVKIGGKSIQYLVQLPIDKLYSFFNNLKLDQYDQAVSKRLLTEIRNRLEFLLNVGLNYLTLNRLSSSLSGGESQRINLATSLGSSLVGSIYIIDEPTIGLHPRDTSLLIKVLRKLQKIGNTVLVVEHDEEIIKSADEVIDIGPLAGRLGGKIIFKGSFNELKKNEQSLTSSYLSGKKSIPVPKFRRKWTNYIEINGAREHNLKGINVKIPLNALTVITGVSGSGKSSLIGDILFPALNKLFNGHSEQTGQFDFLNGNLEMITNVEFVDQNPIGKSSRSNPVTYIKAFDEIRRLYAGQPLSKLSGFKPGHFSFNIDGGRCEECLGEGIIKVEMQFMADVELICESCNGKRYKQEILEVKYNGRNIFDILELTVDEALDLFNKSRGSIEKKIVERLQPLANVGLGYIKLGQSSSTLSGGESQRLKLASFLCKENAGQHKLFIFDEPTTGLHFHDIRKLLNSFDALIEKGHSIIIIEHNPEVIKSADWVIDLGPGGGEKGGYIVFEGIPENLAKCKNSYTGKFLLPKLL
jgi:excinuclease ABC subunit A